jgi:hypothetical protein
MAVGKGEYLLEVKIIDGEVKAKIDGLTKGFVKLDTAAEKLRGSLGGANDGFGQTNSNAGLAGATLTELSRTISDMPYGINAVTNNLSQLSTLFITLQSKTKETAFGLGKFGGTIKGLIKELRGPLGAVLAFQALLTALDFYSKSAEKAKRATKELGDEFAKTNKKVLALTTSLGAAELAAMQTLGFRPAGGTLDTLKELTGDELQKGLKRLSSEFPQFAKMLKANTDPSEAGLNRVIRDFARLAELGGEIEEAYKLVNEAVDPITKQFASSQLNVLIDERISIQERYVEQTNRQRKKLQPFAEIFENDYTMLELAEAQFAGITVEQLRVRKQAREELIESSKAGMDEFNQFSKDFLQKQKDIANANALIEQFKVDTAYRTVDSIRSIGIILESLAGENKGVMVAAIIAEKAAAIGEMIIATTKSNRAIAAAGLAASAFNPAAGAFAKKLILANKIGLGIDIASVVAQAGSAISSIGAPSKGGVGGDSSRAGSGDIIEAPDFNIVGASETSQLAQAVGGSQGKPIKAFVVGKDISTQQELDRNITTTASIG